VVLFQGKLKKGEIKAKYLKHDKISDNITLEKNFNNIYAFTKGNKKNDDKNVNKIIRKTTTQITIPKEINRKR
jgi:hypothetical protein